MHDEAEYYSAKWTKQVPEYRREQDTKRRTKPASNAGLMDGGRPDDIRENGRCDPIGNRGNGKNLFGLFDEAVTILFESDEAGEMVCGAMRDEDLSQTVAVLEGIRFNLLERLR